MLTLCELKPPFPTATEFWNANMRTRFPTLATTLFVMGIPATSVAAESPCNVAGDVLSNRRGHTSDATAAARVGCKYDQFDFLAAVDADHHFEHD